MNRIMQGSEAIVEAAIQVGVKFFAGYPITPSSEISEAFAHALPIHDGVFIQMEDEIASMACVIGASIAGKKTMTATSGPGFSLKQENLGYAIMTEIPCVIVNVQRGGPSTGLPTSPSQGDIMQTRWGTHGDHEIIVLYPTSVQEAYDLTISAVNYSEKYRTPVILLMDEALAHLREKVNMKNRAEINIIDRKTLKESDLKDVSKFRSYAKTKDNIPYYLKPGTPQAYHITGLHHNEFGYYSSDPDTVTELMNRLKLKITSNLNDICIYEKDIRNREEIIIIAYGITYRSSVEAVRILREKNIRVGIMKINTIWPFYEPLMDEIPRTVKTIVIPELNMGQYVEQLKMRKKEYQNVISLQKYDGTIFTPNDIIAEIERRVYDE